MKLKTIWIILLISNLGYSQNNLEISILTGTPGNEIYSVFGHSAIRILDKDKQIDKVYDFGTFDFNTPNFAYKFIKGKLEYHLSVRNTKKFLRVYNYEKRSIIEQKLNLSEVEKKLLIDRLNHLYKPENRYYYYSFLNKNCSTDIRDLLVYVGVDFSNHQIEESNRDLINSYLIDKPWLRLGINTILGKSLDEKSNRFESMFLPKYLQNEINNCKLNQTKLVKLEHKLTFLQPDKIIRVSERITPVIVISLLLLGYLLGPQKLIQIYVIILIGLGGIIIMGLWSFSGHEEVKNNLNILWCNPLYLTYLLPIKKQVIFRFFAILLMIGIVFTIIIWSIQIQDFDISIIPMLILLGLINLKKYKKLAIIE